MYWKLSNLILQNFANQLYLKNAAFLKWFRCKSDNCNGASEAFKHLNGLINLVSTVK